MEIDVRLPYSFCERCSEFILDVDEQILFYGMGGSHRALTVKCKNAAKCKTLKENLDRMGDRNADGQ